MTTRIHYNPASQHARRVHMAVLELGLANEVEMKPVDFSKGEHMQPPYFGGVNPMGKVPTLEEDGFKLFESNAILIYLAEKKPGVLYPTDARGRADVNRWLFWESAHFGRACITLTWERVVKPMLLKQQTDEHLVAQGVRELQRFAKVLDDQLEGREYVAGKLSIADLALASITMYRAPAQMDFSAFPRVAAWLSRIEARDSWKQTQPQM
jgi:glutathione S-transferase